MLLSNDDLTRYQRDGYLLLRQVFDRPALEPVRRVIADFVDDRIRELHAAGKISDPHPDAPFETRWALVSKQLHDAKDRPPQWGGKQHLVGPAIYDLYTDPRLTDIVASILGPELTAHGDYWIRTKTLGDPDAPLSWHQDSTYFLGRDDSDYIDSYPPETVLTVWIPLVEVDERSGCLWLVRGSTRFGAIPFHRNARRQWEPTRDVSHYGTVTSAPMQLGDVLLFNNLTLHTGGNNTTDRVRWSIDLRYSPTGQSFAWHQRGEQVEESYPVFVGRSDDPSRVMSWDQWLDKWRNTWS